MTKIYQSLLKQRKALQAEYQAETGAKHIIQAEMIKWLEGKPDHPIYQVLLDARNEIDENAKRSDVRHRDQA